MSSVSEPVLSAFEGFPLTGLVGVQAKDEHDEIRSVREGDVVAVPIRGWAAVVRRPYTGPDGCTVRGPAERIVVDPRVIAEMQGDNQMGPVFTLYRDEPDPWPRIERELNAAAQRAAARFVS